jgi:hypothetical protein
MLTSIVISYSVGTTLHSSPWSNIFFTGCVNMTIALLAGPNQTDLGHPVNHTAHEALRLILGQRSDLASSPRASSINGRIRPSMLPSDPFNTALPITRRYREHKHSLSSSNRRISQLISTCYSRLVSWRNPGRANVCKHIDNDAMQEPREGSRLRKSSVVYQSRLLRVVGCACRRNSRCTRLHL